MNMLLKKAKRILDTFRDKLKKIDLRERQFIHHNRKVWKGFDYSNEEAEILIETTSMSSSIIAFSYLANLLAKNRKARIKAYVLIEKGSLSRNLSKIYQSFNAEYFCCTYTQKQILESERYFNKLYPTLQTKKDVEDLAIDGLWIGDLVYDSYLRNGQSPTIDLNDSAFRQLLKDALVLYFYWRDYLDSHCVKSVIVTHSVYYQLAIVLRLAIQRGIPCYQLNATSLYYLTPDRNRAYIEFFDFPEKFQELSEGEQRRGLKIAEQRLARRFNGEVGVDMPYSSKSAYANKRQNRVLLESSKIKILLAAHCFFDNPHPYGKNLFPDFYEWFLFLGRVSERTNYEWYIKIHPDFLPGNKDIIRKFITQYPRFTLLSHETSHLDLVEQGVNVVLTVYGTIGFEYAALGVPVINASNCNPHIRYQFNIHPSSVEEYESILLDLAKIDIKIDVAKVYEYYYMKFIHGNSTNWLFTNYDAFIRQIGGYKEQFGPVAYQKFIEQFSSQRHEEILSSLIEFIASKEYKFQSNKSLYSQ